MNYYPEDTNNQLIKTFTSMQQIKTAIANREVIEGRVLLCDSEHNLHIDLGIIRGIIPYSEGALGIKEGTVRDIALISKVNKRVCFVIVGLHKNENNEYIAILSRRAVQKSCMEEYIDTLSEGDIIPAKITHLEKFGAFIDIGAGINSLIPIDMLSVSRISHPRERVTEGSIINTVLKKREPEKLTFSLKELMGTWEENSAMYSVGETVTGVVRSIESYGIFIELTPNLAGLAEPREDIIIGQKVSVYIKSIIPERMKIKLVIVESFEEIAPYIEPLYFIPEGHISHWYYSPPGANKTIETHFN